MVVLLGSGAGVVVVVSVARVVLSSGAVVSELVVVEVELGKGGVDVVTGATVTVLE